MTTPSFVGAGTYITVAPGPSVPTFTVTTSDLPADIEDGDLLFVLVVAGFNGLTGGYVSSDLDAAGYNDAAVRSGGGGREGYIECFVGFYDAADFPADLTFSGTSSWPSTARVETIAYRNVESVPTLTGQTYQTAGSSFSAYLPAPNTSGATAGSATDGLVVQFSYESVVDPAGAGVDVDTGFDVGTVYDAEGFTERHRQAKVASFGGGFVAADNSVDFNPDFVTYNTLNTRHNGVCMQIGLDGKAALSGIFVGAVVY